MLGKSIPEKCKNVWIMFAELLLVNNKKNANTGWQVDDVIASQMDSSEKKFVFFFTKFIQLLNATTLLLCVATKQQLLLISCCELRMGFWSLYCDETFLNCLFFKSLSLSLFVPKNTHRNKQQFVTYFFEI